MMWTKSYKRFQVEVTSKLGTFTLDVTRDATGREVFDRVVRSLGLREFWFFALTYLDIEGAPSWLDLRTTLVRQNLKNRKPMQLTLTVKYYPENVDRIFLGITKRLLYLHMRNYLFEENFYCPPEMALVLASYAAQEQYGDYNPSVHGAGLLLRSDLLPPSVLELHSINAQIVESILYQLYASRSGTSRQMAVDTYLKLCQDLHMYGQRHFPITTARGTAGFITVDSFGLRFYTPENLFVPRTAFHLGELQGMAFMRNKVTISVGASSGSMKFVFFTPEVGLAKRIFLRCIGYRDLFIRRLPQDDNLRRHIMEGAAKDIINGSSTASRSPASIAAERSKVEAIINTRLKKYDEELRAAILKVNHMSRQKMGLEDQVGNVELDLAREETKRHLTLRMQDLYNFHTSITPATIPTLARGSRVVQDQTSVLGQQTSLKSQFLGNLKVLLQNSKDSEEQLRKQLEVEFKTLDELHVFDAGIAESDTNLYKEVEMPMLIGVEPWCGLKSFLDTNPAVKNEVMHIAAELSKVLIPTRQSHTDALYRQITATGANKFSILRSIMSQSVYARMRLAEKM